MNFRKGLGWFSLIVGWSICVWIEHKIVGLSMEFRIPADLVGSFYFLLNCSWVLCSSLVKIGMILDWKKKVLNLSSLLLWVIVVTISFIRQNGPDLIVLDGLDYFFAIFFTILFIFGWPGIDYLDYNNYVKRANRGE